ncbi:hypothetical protein EHR02_00100 [Leptospira levettii]|uniref:hypothetical protein n=1 Tax=Leptospira levettii TaxID=2023178 RepID=UPI001082EA81|nr:hypothetical protein [Leptospira levettii]TGM95039.1 hypothetical protein EHR02_00100 [Leptospira levettii]
MALSVSLNELTYTIPEENETGYGLSLTTYLSDLADYLQFGYLSNVGQRLKLNTVATSGTINNLNTNNISIVRLTQANIVTGIGNVAEGKFVSLVNASPNTIELKHQDALSDANNRFIIPGEKSFYLKPNETITLYYDSSETRWRLIDSSKFVNENLGVEATSGVITTLDTTNKTFLKLTNATEVKGINLPESGRKLYILNATLERIILRQESLDVTANERIITELGYDYILDPEAVVELIYDGNSNRWRTINTDAIRRDKIDVITTSGAIHNLDIARISVIKFTQATEVTGFTGNEEGRELIIFNDNASPLTIKNESSSSTASNRIQTDTNSDVTIRQYGTVILKYDTVSSRWRIKSRTIDNSEYDDTYQLRSEKGVALGYASLDASGTVPVNQIDLSFFDLNDVTSTTFVGQKTKVVKVNNAETGLELGFSNNSSNNYVQFPTSLQSDPLTLGWEVYNDGATPPVDGTGGTPTITLDYRNGALGGIIYEDLNGENSLIPSDWYVLRGSNGTGEGASYPFTIQANHRASILEISFDYYFRFDGTPGFTINADVRAYIIDDDTGEVIQPSNLYIVQPPNKAGSSNLNIPRKYIGTFQTSITSQNYRLCIHVANSLGSRSLFFKNVKIWNQEKNIGSVITDWQPYTPTLTSLGSGAYSQLSWRRVGQNLEIIGDLTVGTSLPSSPGYFSLPNGVKPQSYNSVGQYICGNAIRYWGTIHQCNIIAYSSTNLVGFSSGDGVANASSAQNANSTFSANETLSIRLSVPIQGWGGTVQLSSQVGDGRSVYCLYRNPSAGGTSSTDPIRYTDFQYDSHGAYNTSNGRFTAPISSWYQINVSVTNTGTQSDMDLRKNGSKYLTIGIIHTSGGTIGARGHGSASLYLNAGEYIDIVPGGAITIAGGTFYFFSVQSTNSGSQAFAREEFVGASYYSSANQTSLTTQINFGVKVYDTHNAVTTGSGWKFTAPQSGKYLITGHFVTNGLTSLRLFKNGTVFEFIAYTDEPRFLIPFNYQIDLLAGDYIDLRPDNSVQVNGSASASNRCIIQITKVS